VVVHNFSKSAQTRSVNLTLNGVPVSGSPVSVSLGKGKKYNEADVTFNVVFGAEGTAVLKATLSPADEKPANDTATVTVKVKKKRVKNEDEWKDKKDRFKEHDF